MKVVDLGWCMARLGDDGLVIVSPSCGGTATYEKAESVTISGTRNLIALRDALNEAFPPITPEARPDRIREYRRVEMQP
ncbi:MAG TPA: hypothetical protein VN444_04270 [Verrucomicrobiae bacterium]|nr:hypothetical protein [Verrucomicrobiae bacterium]